MTGALVVVVVLALVSGTALLLASTARITSVPALALAVYLFGFAEVVALSLLLSAAGQLTRTRLLVGAGAFLAAGGGTRLLLGGSPLVSVPAGVRRTLIGSRPALVLSCAVAVALSYVAALVIGTPPNGWDQLNYHLARAALWAQSGIGYIASAYDQRLNIYPPNGEIGFAFVLGLTRGENFAALVQFVAAGACAVGIFALARRLGLARLEAAFGALLFLTLPIVLLQSATTKNDMVLASFLVGAAVFLLGDSLREIGIGSLAVALAAGTKFTAGYGIVVLLALILTRHPRSLLPWRMGGLALGALVGSFWYWVNVAEGGGLLGDRSGIPGLTAFFAPANLVSIVGLANDSLDLSGAQGKDLLLYLVVAATLGSGLAIVSRMFAGGRRQAVLAAALVASPIVVWLATTKVGEPALVGVYHALGSPPGYLAQNTSFSSPTIASDTGSWFGPTGLLLVLGTAVWALYQARRRSIAPVVVVAALAPFVWWLLVSLSLAYDPWQGRFFIFPVALSASLWGLVLRVRVLAWSAVALGVTTALLTLVHYAEKPSGLQLLDRSATASVWTMERWQVQSQHDPPLGPVFQFVDDHVPAHASIALALGVNDFGYPAFGPHVSRHVVLVPFGSSGRDVASDWLVANSKRAAEIDHACWDPVFDTNVGTVFQRRRVGCSG